MTLMNPKPRRNYHRKTILICPICRCSFTADGRGKRIFCKKCKDKKRYGHALNYVRRRALVRRNESAFRYFWGLMK